MSKKIVAFTAYGEMQRRVSLFEARQATMKGLRIFVHNPADQLGIPQQYRGKNMMTGAALDEQIRNFAVSVRPSDRVGPVHVAVSVRISSCVEQRPDYLQVSLRGGPMQRIRVVACFTSSNASKGEKAAARSPTVVIGKSPLHR